MLKFGIYQMDHYRNVIKNLRFSHDPWSIVFIAEWVRDYHYCSSGTSMSSFVQSITLVSQWRIWIFLWRPVQWVELFYWDWRMIACLRRFFHSSSRRDRSSVTCSWLSQCFSIFLALVHLIQHWSWSWSLIIGWSLPYKWDFADFVCKEIPASLSSKLTENRTQRDCSLNLLKCYLAFDQIFLKYPVRACVTST